MRTKSEKRRIEILNAAITLIFEKGYERSSMDELHFRLGYSKATLYNYFPSKQELFVEAIIHFSIRNSQEMFFLIDMLKHEDSDFWHILEAFAMSYLKMILTPDVIKMIRILISEGERFNLNEQLYQRGKSEWWSLLVIHVKNKMDEGQLRKADPVFAVKQFKGLLECDVMERRLCGIIKLIDERELYSNAILAVDTFRRAYSC